MLSMNFSQHNDKKTETVGSKIIIFFYFLLSSNLVLTQHTPEKKHSLFLL